MNEAEKLHLESLHVLEKFMLSSEKNVTASSKVLNEINTNTTRNRKESVNRVLSISLQNNEKENKHSSRLSCRMTPQKECAVVEPSTPTENLKMLVSAASVLPPASDLSVESKEQDSLVDLDIGESIFCIQTSKLKLKKNVLVGRKEKSLGLLCEKFMSFYPEYSENGTTILLDDVVKILGIGRRRVYDIVNVLESMEMMVRQAKNKYLWFGKSRLNSTLAKLKTLAVHMYGKDFHSRNNQKDNENRSGKFLVHIQPKGFNKLNVSNCKKKDDSIILTEVEKDKAIKSADAEDLPFMDDTILNDMKSSRSLGILCQKFIMLFMVSEDNIVTLDKAAKLLLTEPDEGPSKYKTKVRRLYDIANILISIKFLEKCISHEDYSKKAAYRWVGFDLNTLNENVDFKQASRKALINQEFSLTRHSLLAQAPRKASDKKKFQCRSFSAHQLLECNVKESTTPIVLPRTLSAASIKKPKAVEDGFDVYKIEQGDSPRQVLFKEKLRELQKEFPTKLPGNGLLELLSACRSDGFKRTLRRSLSSEFDADHITPEKKLKIDVSLNDTNATDVNLESNSDSPIQFARVSSAVPAIYPVLAPSSQNQLKISENLLRDVNTKSYQKGSSPDSRNLTCSKQSMSVIVKKPLLSSTVESSNTNYYQVVPVRYPCSNKMQHHQLVQLPIVLQQKPVCLPVVGKKAQLISPRSVTSLSRVLMQPPVTSRNVKLQGKSVITVSTNSKIQCISPMVTLNGSVNERNYVSKQLQNYPELCTPPQVIKNDPDGKPLATPILFPKMTPETPSAENIVPHAVLNTVTRKLMSLHSDR
ncbi:transcription factor E2F7 isoform X2 [Hydra vulgaris]|uniref:Transcription factor E2F7 isoform X2 n=1 Tax=Hydra vulgaris TaxID=6087 RepID=A0ABM4D8F6_HYDVU